MDKKQKVEVEINGQTHVFITQDGEAYIKTLASYLNDKIAEISAMPSSNMLSPDRKLILATMNILDEHHKILEKYKVLSQRRTVVQESDKNKKKADEKINSEVQEYIKKIDALQKEKDDLLEKNKNIDYELKYVQQLYEEQKKELEGSKN